EEGEHPDGKPGGLYFKASARFTLVNKEGVEHPGVQFGRMFVSNTHFVADNNKISEYYNQEMAVTNSQEGDVITFVSTQAIKYVGMTYYFRIGFKCNDADKKYNYTDVKTIEVADDFEIPILPRLVSGAGLTCIKLGSDAPLEGGNGANSMFDGSFTQKYETSKSEIWPQSFTVDLGDSYNLLSFRMFPFDREDFYFKRHTVATFTLYGWNGDGEPVDDWNNSNWEKIGDYVNGKPSLNGALPSNTEEYNTLTDEDRDASKYGTVFQFPVDKGKYRYLRFLITNNFNRTTEYGGTGSDGNRFNISELQFLYMPEE
ncbi:MAG: DUF5000 domain-containing lipoprotein, partial [Spirochaetales bacterium]|nr:DUF5000 domain-containing lipoprotein [Spirochaetales bacterium]